MGDAWCGVCVVFVYFLLKAERWGMINGSWSCPDHSGSGRIQQPFAFFRNFYAWMNKCCSSEPQSIYYVHIWTQFISSLLFWKNKDPPSLNMRLRWEKFPVFPHVLKPGCKICKYGKKFGLNDEENCEFVIKTATPIIPVMCEYGVFIWWCVLCERDSVSAQFRRGRAYAEGNVEIWSLAVFMEHFLCRKFMSHQTWTNPLSRHISLSRRIERTSRRRWQLRLSCGDSKCHRVFVLLLI